jgi:transposase-like protein
MGRTHRRYSVEFKLRLVERYLAGEGSAKGLAGQAGLSHALLLRWTEQFRRGALSVALQQREQLQEARQHVAALERKVGQLVMELDLLKKGLIAVPAASSGPSWITSGPAGSPSDGRAP